MVKTAKLMQMRREIDMKTMTRKSGKDVERKVTEKDFEASIDSIKPAFGMEEEILTNNFANGIIHYGPSFDKIMGLHACLAEWLAAAPV